MTRFIIRLVQYLRQSIGGRQWARRCFTSIMSWLFLSSQRAALSPYPYRFEFQEQFHHEDCSVSPFLPWYHRIVYPHLYNPGWYNQHISRNGRDWRVRSCLWQRVSGMAMQVLSWTQWRAWRFGKLESMSRLVKRISSQTQGASGSQGYPASLWGLHGF